MSNELNTERFLPLRLGTVAGAITHAMADVFERRFDLSIPEWQVLLALGGHADSAAVDVVQRTQLDKVAVSRAVRKLVASGLIDRASTDVDRRRAVLNLTVRGRACLDEMQRVALDIEARLLDGMQPGDVDTLFRLLDLLGERTGEIAG